MEIYLEQDWKGSSGTLQLGLDEGDEVRDEKLLERGPFSRAASCGSSRGALRHRRRPRPPSPSALETAKSAFPVRWEAESVKASIRGQATGLMRKFQTRPVRAGACRDHAGRLVPVRAPKNWRHSQRLLVLRSV